MSRFKRNKYRKIYINIITNSKSRINDDSYYEKHHIIPRSLGGSDRKSNIVKLTAKEHFICHRILTKISDSNKLKFAFFAMCNQRTSQNQERDYKITSRTYEHSKLFFKSDSYKTECSIRQTKYLQTLNKKERQEKYGNYGVKNPMYGKTHNIKSRLKISESGKGRIISKKQKTKHSELMKGTFGTKDPSLTTGKGNIKFSGYFLTPYRTESFESANQASKFIKDEINIYISQQTIINRCKNNYKILDKRSITQSKDLNESHLGKTFDELGWNFIPV